MQAQNILLSEIKRESKPSDSEDARNRIVRSKHCPNSASADPTCGNCAWGFYTKEGEGTGENPEALRLSPLHLGYKSQCGRVKLHKDKTGRVGALRHGRFFPGIVSNEAYERYLKAHPHLA